MAKYGALISLPNGNPFITPDSTPMTLYRKVTVNSTFGGNFNSASASVTIDGQKGGIAFARTSAPAKISASKSGNTFSVDASNYRGSAFVLEAYFFAIYPLTLPAWGVAIWDAEGTLVLTNESRVLSDLTTIGSPGAVSGGLNIDTYMAGKWAVNPMGLGSVILQAGSAPGGQPIFQSVDVGTGCHDDTGGTRIRGQSSTTASGASIGSTNSGIVITAINTAAYD
ncbi:MULTISPECIES: hypothetical protein [Citrobacter]|uniref:hypothetical protein n=1 Tax=Citrobacter TaxID=544 RepID=UPI000C77C182|nr:MULTISPECIES: hypothetical protein [Citrobacter]MDM3398126.1 hypothetical protein [Citrobacter sp. Cb016]MDT7061922.1 hypothetical protein [Citrobacter braakii]PLC61376.1 hypothetical protein B9P82_19920 [Citrobacter sp. L55]QLR47571.1 hypothetical protein HV345_10375 [Citrobacter sp. RHBSTW-00986]QYO52791.1 hypothetical protein K1552_08020 [Citrobacter braakii]